MRKLFKIVSVDMRRAIFSFSVPPILFLALKYHGSIVAYIPGKCNTFHNFLQNYLLFPCRTTQKAPGQTSRDSHVGGPFPFRLFSRHTDALFGDTLDRKCTAFFCRHSLRICSFPSKASMPQGAELMQKAPKNF